MDVRCGARLMICRQHWQEVSAQPIKPLARLNGVRLTFPAQMISRR